MRRKPVIRVTVVLVGLATIVSSLSTEASRAASPRGRRKAQAGSGLPQVFLFDPQTLADTRTACGPATRSWRRPRPG